MIIFDAKLKEERDYWLKRLSEEIPLSGVACDRQPGAGRLPGLCHYRLSPDLTSQLDRLCGGSDFLLYTMLLAAVKLCLMRYSGNHIVAVASPSLLEAEAANALVIVSHLGEAMTYQELLLAVRENLIEAYNRQRYPLSRLRSDLGDESQREWYEVGVRLEGLHGDLAGEPPRLLLSGRRRRQDVEVTCEYDAGLYEAATVERLLRHCEQALREGTSGGQRRLEEIEIEEESQRPRMVGEAREYGASETVVEELREAGRRHAEAVAVVSGDHALSYGELHGRVNQLARYLREKGVRAESPVGVLMGRGLWQVVSLLGALKAGGVYVPLEAGARERLRGMVAEGGMKVALVDEAGAGEARGEVEEVIEVEREWEEIGRRSREEMEPRVSGENLAYVIYTSGSTGRPKGVMITHRGLANYLLWATAAYRVAEGNGAPLHTPLGFDLTVTSLLTPLLAGKSVVIVDEAQGVEGLCEILEARGDFSLVKITPSHLDLLSTLLPARQASGLTKALVVGGEALYGEHLSFWREHAPETRIVNEYGPTETVVGCCVYESRAGACSAGAIPIGRPIDNTQLYALNGAARLAATGAPGELYIGGDGVARGYLAQPELTAERFTPDPFSTRPGMRLYGTGDQVRCAADGNLIYLGRRDNQVKLRGYRIELGEIEAALSRHPNVREAVAQAREDVEGDKRLVAYLTIDGRNSQLESECRSLLKRRLPEYMIPSAFVVLDEMPLTVNGKIDRRGLPAPGHIRPDLKSSFMGPRTPMEEMLEGLWSQVLGIDRIGVNDNFFDLGGHSLLATQLVSRVRETFQVEIPLRSVFEWPTVAGLAQQIDTAIKEAGGLAGRPISRVSRESELPLSFAQQRLWFLDQLTPGGNAYNILSAIRLQGPLDRAALRDALSEIVRRHEVLRTTFPTKDGKPAQVISPAQPLEIAVSDLIATAVEDRESEARRHAYEEAQRPFDLAAGPLLRVKLLRFAEDEHVALFTLHHIVSDGWSMGILAHEVARLYDAFSREQSSPLDGPLDGPLDELPIQYADFAHWQQNWLQGAVLQSQLDYWKRQLAGSGGALELAYDRPRPAVQTSRGSSRSFSFSRRTSDGLKTLSREQRATLFMTLLAAFQTLLFRYSGQKDILIGSPIANRNRAEIEGLIGFFVNTLVFRTDLSGDPAFIRLLKRVRETSLGAYAHQDLPFEHLVKELQPERSMSHTPLFQVTFDLDNSPRAALELSGMKLTALGIDTGAVHFDLSLSMADTEQGLAGSLQYNADLFDDLTIARMLGHFETLVESIVADPHQPISRLPLLAQPERRRILVEWNSNSAGGPAESTFKELFEAQARRSPAAIAVVCGTGQLSYEQLNQSANQLARQLTASGVGAEQLVAVLMERSLDMAVGLIAVLKAGAAYAPLDPDYPPPRLARMLEDCRPKALITQRRLLDRVPATTAQVFCLDRDAPADGRFTDPTTVVHRDNLAYAIYTSGSTGRPKAALITNGGLADYVRDIAGKLELGPGDRILQFASISFDVAVEEMFPTWAAGGAVILREGGMPPSADELLRLIERQRITGLELPTAYWSEWVYEMSRAGAQLPDYLRFVIVGGENILPERLENWRRLNTPLVHVYGLTETTITSTTYRMAPGATAHALGLPIGRPTGSAGIYLLDKHLEPLPAGVRGEIHIEGSGLARGYLNCPDLTAERFIANPHSAEPGTRLYRTGDAARHLPDGNILFVNRVDHQVKIRGYRVELGEIEAALAEHPAVRDTVVTIREDTPGQKRLVAYVTPGSGHVAAPDGVAARRSDEPHVTFSKLREYLNARLPDYMVPSAFVALDALPLTPNGKIDRRALPDPVIKKQEPSESPAAFHNPVEVTLAGIWADVLGVERAGAEDNFFDLGGHSLLAIQVISRVRDSLRVELPLRALFEMPTLSSLALGVIQLKAEQQSDNGADDLLARIEQLSDEEARALLLN